MLSFTRQGWPGPGRHADRRAAAGRLRPSLAGVASSITHPGKTSHRALSAEALTALDIHDGTIRVSVGIEDSEDIVSDFLQALDAL
jgi:cystathionine gamma-synthase (EC 2.5.1.48)